MAVGLAIGSQLHFVAGAIAAACIVNIGMCFTWPVLEALVSEGANAARAVGIYNITWASANASAYFIGGTLIVKFGYQSMFYLPLAFVLVQFAMVLWLKKIYGTVVGEPGNPPPPAANRPTPARAKSFQRLAWLANPFAYIAINTLLAVIPGLAARFGPSPMLAGFVCSLWCFVRLGTFVLLWRWPGWHYRFRWLVTAFSALVLSFAAILIVPSLAVLVVAQIFFRRGHWAHLLFVAVLLDGCERHEKRTRRYPRGGHRRRQFFRTGRRRGVTAISAAIREQRCRRP